MWCALRPADTGRGARTTRRFGDEPQHPRVVTKYPRVGGASHYAILAYGPFRGFLAGFCMLAAGVVSAAAPWPGGSAATTSPSSSPSPSSCWRC